MDDSKVVLLKTLVGSYNALNIFFSKFILSYVFFTIGGGTLLTPRKHFVNQPHKYGFCTFCYILYTHVVP